MMPWVTGAARQDQRYRPSFISLLALLVVVAFDVSKGQTAEERQAIARDWVKSALITVPLTLIGVVVFSLIAWEVMMRLMPS